MDIRSAIERKFGNARRSGNELIVVCPECGKRKLSINSRTGFYQCWHGCMRGRNVGALLGMKVDLSRRPVERKAEKGFTPPGEIVRLSDLEPDHQAVQYLESRGFSIEELDGNYGIAYCRRGRKFAGGVFDTSNTVVIPVYENGRTIAWQSRLLYSPESISEDMKPYYGFKWDADDGRYVVPPKYFTMPGYMKGSHLWNIDWARRGQLVVVTEGVFDSVRVGRSGVCTFGKNLSEEQVNALKSYWDYKVLLLDPDAEEDQEDLAPRLGGGVVQVHLEGYKDAGECPREELWRQIHGACSEAGLDIKGITHYEE